MHSYNYINIIKILNFPKDYHEDFTDTYFSEVLPFLFTLFSIFTGLREYLFQPIICWTPKLWTKSYEEYTKSICWSENTYFINLTTKPPNSELELETLKIKYYQWVPLFLISLTFILIIPGYIWKTICGSMGLDINHVIRMASKANVYEEATRIRILAYINFIIRLIIKKYNFKNKTYEALSHSYKTFFPYIVLYILIKILYISTAVLEIYFLQIFLQMEHFYFPIKLIKNFSEGKLWYVTGKFPVVTHCRIMIKENIDIYYRNIQCILPSNVIYDKLCIAIWMLLILGIILMLVSIFYWIAEVVLVSKRKKFMSKQLVYHINNINTHDSQKLVESFIQNFLTVDGLFFLHILEKHVDSVNFQIICENLWDLWKQKCNL